MEPAKESDAVKESSQGVGEKKGLGEGVVDKI